MTRKALIATEVAVKGEGDGHVVLDRGQIRDLLNEENLVGMYKYALHERSLPTSVGEPQREFPVGEQGAVLLEERPKAESVISSSLPDRDGDIMVQQGLIITENYTKNPTVFGLHEHTIPVGFTELLRQYETLSWARWQWLTDIEQSEGKDYYEMWVKHVLNCTSVGFLIDKWEPLDADNFWGGWNIQEWELLEHSPVSLPSNREAMRTDGLKSLFRSYAEQVYAGPSPVLRKWFEEIEHNGAPVQVPVSIRLAGAKELQQAVREGVAQALKDGDEARVSMTCKVDDIADPIDLTEACKGAISYSRAHPDGTPKADPDTSWDNGKERAAADVEDLKVMCAWVEDDGGENKGDYKFAHHHQSNKAVNKRACSAIIGVLNGARGGTNIPDDDRGGVYAHAKKHLVDDFSVPSEDVPELKEWTQEKDMPFSFDRIRLAAASGVIEIDKAFELITVLVEAQEATIAERDTIVIAAMDRIHSLEAEITNLSGQIVETLG